MKRVFDKTISAICLGIVFFGCEDVFEENISNDSVTVIYPKDNENIVGNSVVFNWNGIEGADDYRIQVLRSNSQELLIDSLFSSNTLALPLDIGEYDWRIRGENFAYKTSFSFPESFSVESTDDLSSQKVFLNSPSDNFYTRNKTIIVNWSVLAAATSYGLQIEKTVSNSSSIILQQDDIDTNNYTLDNAILSEDAIYKWGVRALNENGQTGLTKRNILLDTKTPNLPVLVSPIDNEKMSQTVDFSWNLGTDSGEVQSPRSSILEIASDSNYSSIIRTYSTAGETQQHIFESTGDYYWRVKLVDSAGNESEYTETRTFKVE